MKIQSAEIRLEGDHHNLYIMLAGGPEYYVDPPKAFVLIQGVAPLPEDMNGPTLIVFTVPEDEDSDMMEIENATTDAVYVHLCREALAMPRPARRLAVPTLAAAKAAKWKATPDGVLTRL